jgi:hypothetical protein
MECYALLATSPQGFSGTPDLNVELKIFLSSLVRILDDLLMVGPTHLVYGVNLVRSQFVALPTSIATKQVTGFTTIVCGINPTNATKKWTTGYGSQMENHMSKRSFFTNLPSPP